MVSVCIVQVRRKGTLYPYECEKQRKYCSSVSLSIWYKERCFIEVPLSVLCDFVQGSFPSPCGPAVASCQVTETEMLALAAAADPSAKVLLFLLIELPFEVRNIL